LPRFCIGIGGVLVSYLSLRRGQIIIACFLSSSLLLASLPGIDIYVSRFFFDGGFQISERWWQKLLRDGISYFVFLSMALVMAIYLVNRFTRQTLWAIDGRKVCYLFLVLILGAGLIVNVGFKDNFGRARPRDVEEFGGQKQFTPAFVISRECTRNCSFSCGEGAAGFFSLALALALSRRRRIFAAAVGLGILVSISRIVAGAHFFSDTVVSFFVMLVVADVLYHYIVMTARERQQSAACDDALVPVPAPRSPRTGAMP
jgi:lipid A 4'-phosphatase